MYQLIGSKRSRTFRVIWMLEELGADYALTQAGPRSAEVMAVNPSGKVPVLLTEGHALTDSAAILQFLADKHSALTFPAGSLDRARQDSLMHFVLDEMDATLWTAARHSFVLPEAWRVPEVKESLRWEWRRSLERLARHLGDGPFLMGEVMTVADILAAHCLRWGVNAKFAEAESALADYLQRLQDRPAFQRADAV